MEFENTKDDPLATLQARIDKGLFERYQRAREKWGMNNQEFMERIVSQSLPLWEQHPGPPVPGLGK